MSNDITTPKTAEEIKAAENIVLADMWDGYADTLAENGSFTQQWLKFRAMAAKFRGFTFTAEMATAELVEAGVIKP